MTEARRLLVHARAVLGSDRFVDAQIVDCSRRLEEPLRVALAGTVKAGKSTLLNALVGEEIAPSDATECTRVITWFVRGSGPAVTLSHDGTTESLPVVRDSGKLRLDLGSVTADRVDRLEVAWPSMLLDRYTIVDTPGTASNSVDVSERTRRLLAPADGRCPVDVVVYLTRELQQADVDLLRILRDKGTDGPLGVIGVLSRADEVHGGRSTSMSEAHRASRELARSSELEGLHRTFLPVSGLMALRGRTLRQSEFENLKTLSSVPDTELGRAMVSASRFPAADLPVSPDERAALVTSFGLHGIRTAVDILRTGVDSAVELASELVRRSGLADLERQIQVQFGERHEQLRVRSALLALQSLLEKRLDERSAGLLTEVDHALADDHSFVELQVLADLHTDGVRVTQWQRTALERILGGCGTRPHERLGVPPAAPFDETALSAVRYWRAQLAHPLLDAHRRRAFRAAERAASRLCVDSGHLSPKSAHGGEAPRGIRDRTPTPLRVHR